MIGIRDDAVYQGQSVGPPIPVSYVVVTRFNMYYPGLREKAGIDTAERMAEWIKGRTEVFQRICLPSLLAQTRKPDAWLIGFDAEFRKELEPLIETVSATPWIRPMRQRRIEGEYERAHTVLGDALSNIVTRDGLDLLSTRVDNDDALSIDHCAAALKYATAVRSRENPPEDFWIVFPFGMQYDGSVCRVYTHPRNHFLSRFESLKHLAGRIPASALGGNHGRVLENPHVYMPITQRPMWMQYVHGANVSNRSMPGLPLLGEPEKELARFGQRARQGA